ncbi:Protein GIGANTEA [Linum grandiflorum]
MAVATSSERWIDGLHFSSLFWPPPQDVQQRKAQVTAYVEYFGQFTSDQFPDDIAELIRSRYPSLEKRLFDDVLATFVLHHPEHGHAVVLPIISSLIDGGLVYDKSYPPFASFISLVCPSNENEYSEQWALACGEILRILTHYNRPIYKKHTTEPDRSSSGSRATTSQSSNGESSSPPSVQQERKPLRPLSPWITDILLAAPLGIRSDYFRWCSGVMGKYAAGELKPPITAASRGSGKHPQLMPSTPRWAVANGAGVILSVCDEEVARYETATLTAAAVPALLLPPPTTSLDEHLVAGLPALEPYARLFHRYYAIATPSATQRLLLGLLEAPPSWAPDALDAAVQLVELLRAAEDYANGIRLPRNWMHLHFLRAIGTAMSMGPGIAADAAAALLFRILSQPALLFPPLRQVDGVEVQHEPLGGYISSYRKQADRELQPWIAKDDDQSQKIWRINQRIVKLIVELMRNHDTPESLVILASASDLLLRATDGMLVDGEACTLPQLELLEATARAVRPVVNWGETGFAIADGLSNLLKCRLPATVRCLSHPSAHVRALSLSVLRDILHNASIKTAHKHVDKNGTNGRSSYQYFNVDVIDWQADIEKCLAWEAHSQLARGTAIDFLDTAAKELGCTISV